MHALAQLIDRQRMQQDPVDAKPCGRKSKPPEEVCTLVVGHQRAVVPPIIPLRQLSLQRLRERIQIPAMVSLRQESLEASRGGEEDASAEYAQCQEKPAAAQTPGLRRNSRKT